MKVTPSEKKLYDLLRFVEDGVLYDVELDLSEIPTEEISANTKFLRAVHAIRENGWALINRMEVSGGEPQLLCVFGERDGCRYQKRLSL